MHTEAGEQELDSFSQNVQRQTAGPPLELSSIKPNCRGASHLFQHTWAQKTSLTG
jgi:hypothetical protein